MRFLRLRIIRWKYVIPRLLILLVIAVALRLGLDPALHWAIVKSGESATGAKVDLADVETSLMSGQLLLKEFALTNPQSPMRNLCEATDMQLQLDVNALLHGRVVVTDGTISGLRFDTDRETSGALVIDDAAEDTGPSVFDPLVASAGQMGEEWFDDLGDRLDTDIASQLQSPKLAKELQARWPQQYEELQTQVKSIRTRGKQLEKSIREVKKNPLRGLEKLVELQQEIVGLQQEIKSVQQQIAELPKQAEQDRQAVLAAREQDEALLREKLQIGTLDGEGLTQTLLGQPVTEGLNSALEWVSWARDQIPSNPAKEKASRSRGTTVVFTPSLPDYHVKLLMLEGDAQLNGQPLKLTGSLTNASSSPKLLDQPTQLLVRGSGELDVNVNVTMDRREEIAKDTLQLTCPQMAIAGRTLGNAKKLAIEMDEGLANFQIDMSIVDDAISGQILFEQESLSLTPRLAKSPNGQLAMTLQQALDGVQRLEASVTLAGTIKKPKFNIKSDIGSQVAAGLNASVKNLVEGQKERLLAKTRAEVDAQLGQLTKLRENAQQQLLASLGENQELLGQLTALTGGGGATPGLPASIPQLGKKLRLGDILKK